MKKRFISMLLAVLLVVSLFAGTSVSAYADGDFNIVNYTLVSGDTLLQICNNMGLNFFTCKTAIDKLNGFTSDSQYNRLKVGQVIKLPATNEEAAKIAASYVPGGSGGSTGGGSTGGSTGGNVSGNVAYWLIPYTIQSGETITGVCNTLGISFSTYADQIMKINNISSWNRIPAGKTLLLPSAVKPAAGISCYAVVAHKVAQGETTYGICQNYGISYTSSANLLQALNPKINFNYIKYNTTMLVPVPTVITAGDNGGGSTGGGSTGGGSTGGGSTGGGSTGGGSTGGSGGNVTKTYAIKSSTSGGGTLSFSVGGKAVNAASAGSTVVITTNPEAYKTLENIRVVTADNSAVISVSNGSFTMPECDVRVEATFGTGYLVGPVVNGSGTLSCYVNNVPITHAVKGATVKVTASPSAGYTFNGITVKTFTGSIVAANLKSGDTFTMPGEKVLVYANFASANTYSFNKQPCSNGSFSFQVMGTEVTSAGAGATVKVVTKPNNGYALDSIVVKARNGQNIAVGSDQCFIMPASNVDVTVNFKKADTTYSVTVNNSQEGGTATATVSKGNITLEAFPYEGYQLDHYIVEYSGASYTTTESVIAMPNADVYITPVFTTKQMKLVINNSDANLGDVTVTVNGAAVSSGTKVNAGDVISVSVVTKQTGYKANVTINGSPYNGSYTVPVGGKVTVDVSYEAQEFTLTVDRNWGGFFELVVNGQATKVPSDGCTMKVTAGTQVTAQLLPEYQGQYKIVGVQVDGKTYGVQDQNWIMMPGANATLKVLIESTASGTDALAPLSGDSGSSASASNNGIYGLADLG